MSNENIFLDGNKIYLRNLTNEDAKGNYSKWFNDLEVCKYNSHGIFPVSIPDLEEFILNSTGSKNKIVLGIFEKKSSIHIGNISLQEIDWVSRNAEFAIIIGEKNYWKGGYGKEASDLILYHGFIRMNLNRIYCGTSEDNLGMQKLALYMKMIQEGIRRSAFYKNGEYRNIIEYGILRNEYVHLKC